MTNLFSKKYAELFLFWSYIWLCHVCCSIDDIVGKNNASGLHFDYWIFAN